MIYETGPDSAHPARNIREGTLKRYQAALRQLCAFAAELGATELAAVDRALLRAWRESRTRRPSTQATDLQVAKGFFLFAHREKWITENPIQGLKPPRPDSPPTMPLSEDEMERLVAAAPAGRRERALILLMRYSGLAISGAATLPRAALAGQLLTLRRAKSGELVVCELPPLVAAELDGVTPRRQHYCWNGQSKRETVTGYWRAPDEDRPPRPSGGVPPPPPARHVRRGHAASRRGHARPVGTAGAQQRGHHGEARRPVRSGPPQAAGRVVRHANRQGQLLQQLAAQATPADQGDAAGVRTTRRCRPSNPKPILGDVAA